MCELIKDKELSTAIIPIIEPFFNRGEHENTEQSGSRYDPLREVKKFISAIAQSHNQAAVVINPQQATISPDFNKTLLKTIIDSCAKVSNISPALLTDQPVDQEIFKRASTFDSHHCFLIQRKVDDSVRGVLRKLPRTLSVQQVLYSNTSLDKSELHSHNIKTARLKDHFVRRKNADYSEKSNDPNEQFSIDKNVYSCIGDNGFADYSIIGHDLPPKRGWRPRAVALHIIGISDNIASVHHYVSDTVNNSPDIPGKYAEAVSKLQNDVDNHIIQKTRALNYLLNYKKANLPTIKKYSIMHELELIGSKIQ